MYLWMDGYMNKTITSGGVVNEQCRRDSQVTVSEKKFIDCSAIAAQSGVTKSEAEAAGYLLDHRIGELFGFLMAQLASEQPSDPIGYLFDLLDKCLLFRAGLVEPPLLFAPRHIESIYKSLDPAGVGHISVSQYAVGMKTLGIDCFNPEPAMTCNCNPDRVDKNAFMREAKSCLVKMLKEMIAKPQEC